MAILKYFDSIRMLLRKGTAEDPYVLKTENVTIINNKASLDEVPDSFYHVVIDGYSEIYKDTFDEVKMIASNQFYVDYQNGMLYFNESENGKSLTAIYKGRGVIQYPAERIWVHGDNPWAVDNLQQFIDFIFSKIKEINDKVVEFTTFVNNKYTEFVNYVNAYIVKADAKIDEMDITIDNAQVATEEANTATINAKNATIEAINATTDLTKIKEDAVTATNNAIVATGDAIEATNDAIEETTAMHVDRLNTRYIYQEPVETFADITIQYPSPEVGWRVMTKNNGNVYRFSGTGWTYVENLTGGVPLANLTEDGLMSAKMFEKLSKIEDEAQKNFTGENAKLVLPSYFRYKTFVFILSGELNAGVQNVILQVPSNGIIKGISAFCQIAGAEDTLIQIDKISQSDFQNNIDSWSPLFYPESPIIFEYAQKVSTIPMLIDNNVMANDYLRARILHFGAGIQDITIQINVEI